MKSTDAFEGRLSTSAGFFGLGLLSELHELHEADEELVPTSWTDCQFSDGDVTGCRRCSQSDFEVRGQKALKSACFHSLANGCGNRGVSLRLRGKSRFIL